MIFKINRTFLELMAIILIIGGVFYFGFREFSQLNNQIASLQEQLSPLIEKTTEEPIIEPITEPITQATSTQATSTATAAVSEETVPEEPELNLCESLDCNAQDGWVDSGSTFICQNSNNQTCTCQTQAYFNYSCSTVKQKCVYSTTNTRTSKYNCVNPTYPDLIFQSPGFSPAAPVAGDQIYFEATLKNQGSALSGPSLSYLKIDGQKKGEFSSASLASGSSAVVSWPTSWQAIEGSHELEVCADGALQSAESDETNNCAKTTFTVGAGSTVPLSDLIIDSVDIAPAPLLAGQLVSFSTIVKNQGKASAKPSLVVPSLDLGNNGTWDQYPGAVQTKTMAVNGNETIFWRNVWTSTSGTHKIEVCADAASETEFRMTESNETNNCLSKIFIVP